MGRGCGDPPLDPVASEAGGWGRPGVFASRPWPPPPVARGPAALGPGSTLKPNIVPCRPDPHYRQYEIPSVGFMIASQWDSRAKCPLCLSESHPVISFVAICMASQHHGQVLSCVMLTCTWALLLCASNVDDSVHRTHRMVGCCRFAGGINDHKQPLHPYCCVNEDSGDDFTRACSHGLRDRASVQTQYYQSGLLEHTVTPCAGPAKLR